MQVVNKKMCVIVILVLVIIESCTLFLMYKSYGNKNTNLDEVNLNISNANMFAIMLEQDDGTYKEDTSNTWPTSGYTYNETMSGCIDINGNKLDGVLSYDAANNIATVDTGKTSYCYLYFSIKQTAGEYLLKNPSNGLVTTSLQGGLYRYQGTDDVDNYICFGTRDKDTCTNDTNTYMYRIIGITSDNKLKLIKKETFEMDKSSWSCSSGSTRDSFVYADSGDIIWPDSSFYRHLNGIDYPAESTFVNGTLYPYMSTTSSWYNLIESVDWKFGRTGYNVTYQNYNASSIYEIENGFTDSINAKIGLIYIHDYYYANNGGIPGNASNAKTSWIHLGNNDTEFSFCFYAATNADFFVTQEDYENSDLVTYSYVMNYDNGSVQPLTEGVMRPVFYLKSNIEITGTGTTNDPFIIN